jgi:hypothetical protein
VFALRSEERRDAGLFVDRLDRFAKKGNAQDFMFFKLLLLSSAALCSHYNLLDTRVTEVLCGTS